MDGGDRADENIDLRADALEKEVKRGGVGFRLVITVRQVCLSSEYGGSDTAKASD